MCEKRSGTRNSGQTNDGYGVYLTENKIMVRKCCTAHGLCEGAANSLRDDIREMRAKRGFLWIFGHMETDSSTF